MNSSRPYLIRALYEWVVDNDCTPHILVSSEYPKVRIPAGFARDGQIVLNISPNAVRYLEMNNEEISFEGRFNGVPQHLYIPTAAVLAIYARENGQGMFFELEESDEPNESQELTQGGDEDEPDLPPTTPTRPSGRPQLKVVK